VTCQHGGSRTPARRAGSQITRCPPAGVVVHKRTDSHVAACQDRYTLRRPRGGNHMLFIVGIIIVLTTVVIIPRMQVPASVNSANLGWMSEQWLAQHRASHSL
jgi:hypothetical protein